ncbi:hypothetical protein [Bradyrhizobium cosmicum]|uniref:hypothetical protein n=1 Tax=Bradyrhizobium cosmicum TaxID=1404864 RepID=UPI001FCED504|nr:hypothetical protein [Bradyrhizobium cosmicum]
MTALSSYSTGTVAVSADGTAVTGTSTLWLTAGNVKPGDELAIGHFRSRITDVTDDTHMVITPWPGSTVSGSAYTVWKVSQQRIVGETYARDVDRMVGALNTSGYFVFVDIGATAPDPSLGDDGQFAFQPTTGKTWAKSAGVWSFLGFYKAFNLTGAYNGATVYSYGDVQVTAGSSYIYINATPSAGHTAPNPTYWQLLASIGATGNTGATGAGYGGTSTTSLAIGTGSKVFTTQAGLAYANGARVRASSAANTANWMEGRVTYSGTTLTMTADKTGGSGTLADWNLNVTGEPGAGDLLSTNNLSDVVSADQARANLAVAGRNYLLNPSGEIDQEGVGGGVSRSDATYDFDQWLALTQSNPITVSLVADAENGTPFMMRGLQANATAQRFGRIQWIESRDCKELRGRAVTLSARVRMSAATTLRYAIVEWTGAADTITKDVINDWTNSTFTAGQFFTSTSTTVVATGSQALAANTLANISLSGTISGSMNNLAVIFWTDSAQAQNVTLDIGKAKLEPGSVATSFAAPRYEDELLRCCRYFVAITTQSFFGGGTVRVGGTDMYAYMAIPAPMRVLPTVSITGMNVVVGDTVTALASLTASKQTGNMLTLVPHTSTSAGSTAAAMVFYNSTTQNSLNARI